MIGQEQSAAPAARRVAAVETTPSDVLTARSLLADGQLEPAELVIRAYLKRHGLQPEAMRVLAQIGMAREALEDAELLLDAALIIAPEFHSARADYALTLLQRHKYAQAREQIDQLLALAPASPDYRALAAAAATGLGEHQSAIGIYRGLLADLPDSADIRLWLADALKTVGQVPEAIEAYRAATAIRPDCGGAYWGLADLKRYRFSDAEIERMRGLEAALSTPSADRLHLCFALGKAYEDRGDPASAWRYYERGDALKRAQSRHRPELFEINTANQIKVCTSDFFARRAGWGAPAPDPIFILGLPRSGSTLVEQILASHSQVEGTQELFDIQRIVLEMLGRNPDLTNPKYPANLTKMTQAEARALGERYLADTQVYRSGKPFFIDKMPNNFQHIGLIHLILPKARIIDVRREPMACCFGNLKQLFAQGQEFSYSIEDVSRYYRTYLDLMDHWDRVSPGRVLRVQLEDMIEDLEASVRRLLDYCGLPFEPACVEFHTNRRSVSTPSAEQVRQPIYREGQDLWKAYEPWLEPLKLALGDALERYRG